MSYQEPILPVRADSDDEWLQELLITPVPLPVVVGTDSDDEFLQDLLTPPPGSTPGTLLASRAIPEPRPIQQRTLQRPAQATERRSRANVTRPGEIPCVGCPEEMLVRHGELLAGIVPSGQIRDFGIMVFFRRDTFKATWEWVQGLSVSLCETIHGLLQAREICIFKIGITRDPYYRMHNEEFGYTQCDEIYDQMDLLVASYPGICASLEWLCIQRTRSRPGCRNDAPGGESAPASGLCYLYVVSLPCGDGRPIPRR